MQILKKAHKILIVDDTPMNIQLLGQILAEEKYEVIVATNGKEAIAVLGRIIPDLILLDVMMPEMDGYETCRRIKEEEKFSEIPVIFLTAKTEKEDVVKGFKLGGADYITKPFNAPELLSRVHLQLSLKEKTEELKQSNEKNKELVRVLMHDLRNPIGSIKMANEIGKANLDILPKMNDLIAKAVGSCMDILESVKKIYSVDDRKYVPELQSIKLEKSIQSVLFIFEHQLEEKKITIQVDIPKDITVYVEGTSFVYSVFNNLLTNAIKFSFPNSRIVIKAFKEEKQVVLSIKDDGLGISKKILDNIFDISKPTSRLGTNGERGTGYGMPLVKKFVEIFSGRIEIKSIENPKEGHGTEVILFLKENAD